MQIIVPASTIAEAVQQAARVSPSKGEAFDKAAGIAFRRTSGANRVEVVATDLETTFIRRVPILLADSDEDFFWRLPAGIAAGYLAGVVGTDEDVTIGDYGDGKIHMACGTTSITLSRFATDYPNVVWADTADWEVEGFGTAIKRVTWAVAPSGAPLTGVHITGEHLVACDRVSMAFTDLMIPVAAPITVPLGPMAAIMKRDQTVSLAGTENRFYATVDDGSTQMSAIIYADPYPNTARFLEVAASYTNGCMIWANHLRAAIQRMLVLCKGERYPVVCLEFRNGLIPDVHITMDVPEVGRMEDSVPIENFKHDGDAFTIWFTPDLLVKALEPCGNNEVGLKWDTSIRPIAVACPDESYICMVQARVVSPSALIVS